MLVVLTDTLKSDRPPSACLVKRFLKVLRGSRLSKEELAHLPAAAFALGDLLLLDGVLILLGHLCVVQLGEVQREDVDCAVVRGGRDVVLVAAKLDVADLRFVGTAAEHVGAGWAVRVDLPNSDKRALLAGRREQVALAAEGHRGDAALVAHDDGFHALVRKGAHLHVAFLRVGDREHAVALGVQCAEAIRVVARVEAVNQGEVREIVDIGLHGEDDDHAAREGVSPRATLLTRLCAA